MHLERKAATTASAPPSKKQRQKAHEEAKVDRSRAALSRLNGSHHGRALPPPPAAEVSEKRKGKAKGKAKRRVSWEDETDWDRLTSPTKERGIGEESEEDWIPKKAPKEKVKRKRTKVLEA